MSKADADQWVNEQLDKIQVNARDRFYEHLVTQEIPFWYRDTLDGKKVDDSGVETLIKWRGFNAQEQESFRTFAKFFNDNGQHIRLLWCRIQDG
jgi:hypothetical protein